MTPVFVFIGVLVVLFALTRVWQSRQRGRLAKRHVDALHVLARMTERRAAAPEHQRLDGDPVAPVAPVAETPGVVEIRPAAAADPPQQSVRLLRGQEPSPGPGIAAASAPGSAGPSPARAPAFVFDDLAHEGNTTRRILPPPAAAGPSEGAGATPPGPGEWPGPATARTAPTWGEPAPAPPMVFDDYLLSGADEPRATGIAEPGQERRWAWPVVSRRWAAAAAAGLAAVVALVAFAATSSGGGGHRVVSSTGARSATGGSPSSRASTGSGSSPSAPAPTTPAASAGRTRPTTAGPTTAVPAIPAASGGSGPVLTSLSPSSGPSGQTVTLRGAGMFSASQVITVTFGGSQAPIVCPNQTTCRVTVPDLGPSKTTRVLLVTVHTDSGASNPLAFRYS